MSNYLNIIGRISICFFCLFSQLEKLGIIEITGRSEDRADESVPERSHSLVLVDYRSVRQFVVSLCGFDEFSPVIQHPGVADFVVNLQLFVLRLCLKK